MRPCQTHFFSKVLLKSLARSLKFYLQTLSPALMVFVFRKPRFLLHSVLPDLMKTGLRPKERPVFSKVLLKSLARSIKFYLQTLSSALMVFVFRKPRFLLYSLLPDLMKTGLRPRKVSAPRPYTRPKPRAPSLPTRPARVKP